MAQIYQIYGKDAHDMTIRLMEAARVCDMIPAGASVALKPNLVVAASADSGATTHPGVLSGAIEYLREHGFSDISIIEGSWIGDRTDSAMRAAGYDAVCRTYNVPFFDLKKDVTRNIDTPIGPMPICCRALDAGFLIDLPVLKGHCQTVMTCALKNLKGCLPDREKRRFHTLGLHKPIAALGAALKPDLIIVDSICGDLDFEEGGTPVETNRMYLGTDPVQIDTYGCELMGIDPMDVDYLPLAQKWGAGRFYREGDDIITLNEPTQGMASAAPRGTVAQLTRNVKQDKACSACYASLVRALYTTGAGQKEPIIIGQGWKGVPFDGLGIGACCNCAARQVKGCPPTAADIAEALLGR